MWVRRWGALVVVVLGCASAPPKQPGADFAALERSRIAELELARDTRGDVLTSRARLHADPSVRARALLALGRIQDLGTAPTVAAALGDASAPVRAMASFAAGELALAWEPVPDETRDLLSRALLEAEAKETDGAARLAEVDALGRVRTPAALERLVLLLAVPTGHPVDERDPRSEVPVRAAIALGVAARAKAALPEAARPGLERLARHLLPVPRWAGVYALGQLKTPASRPVLLAALRDDDAEVRATAAKGLGEVALAEDAPALKALLRDPDGRAAAEAVRGLVTLTTRCAPGPCPAADALAELDTRATGMGTASLGQTVPPLLALAQSPVPESARRVLVRIRTTLRAVAETSPDSVRATAAWLDCRMAAAEDRQRGWLDETLRCGHDRIAEARRLRLGLEAVASSPRLAEARVQKALVPFLRHPSPQVRAAAAGVPPAAKAVELTPALRPLLQDPDPIVRASAVDALASLGDKASAAAILAGARTVPVDVVTTYADALVKLKPPGTAELLRQWLTSPHAHVRHDAARALTALEGTPVRAPSLPAKAEAPAAAPVAAGTLWRIETAHGPVVITPDVDVAPATVAQLSRLAREGYFRGLTFHRVVPDFVVQGGDPRGDGEGGPGFSLPCEVSPRTYLRGTVGMALSGKDTGGSQIFVALSPQPHLDGRYTIIGTVTSGMEALDGMVEGDPLSDWVIFTP
jgi:cyclophilin family peptidyl-prolyl cis-trans isomerase/HEAT repeat protein